MRWQSGRRSENVEDIRHRRVRPAASLGGGGILLIILLLLFGVEPSKILQLLVSTQPGSTGVNQSPYVPTAGSDEAAQFVSVVLADTEDVWEKLFGAQGGSYQPPKLVLFSDAVESACGFSSAATGPFYCPLDNKAYLDLSFFEELRRLGGRGDFAGAYVIAHEIGHHVQNVLGILPKASHAQRRMDQAGANALQVQIELQADCLAGVWAHHANKDRAILEEGDIDEALQTAAAIGDDRLLQQAGRTVRPESFTHGSSEQRRAWLLKGLQTGDVSVCNS